jgi:hypothetical protein
MPQNPKADVLHAGIDSRRSILTEIEPLPKDFSAPIAERLEISPEITETPTAGLENMQLKEDNNSDGGNTIKGNSMVANDGGL